MSGMRSSSKSDLRVYRLSSSLVVDNRKRPSLNLEGHAAVYWNYICGFIYTYFSPKLDLIRKNMERQAECSLPFLGLRHSDRLHLECRKSIRDGSYKCTRNTYPMFAILSCQNRNVLIQSKLPNMLPTKTDFEHGLSRRVPRRAKSMEFSQVQEGSRLRFILQMHLTFLVRVCESIFNE